MKKSNFVNHSTSREYELIVHNLIKQEMSGLDGIEFIDIKHNKKMTGLSGYTHQIDVSYRFRVWKIEMLVIVECKQYKGKVGINDLLEFRSRIDDLRAQKGLFVTTKGFQSGAIEYAEANGIALLIAKGTQHRDIRYSLKRIPPLERCQSQIQALVESFSNLNQGLRSRLSTNRSRAMVSVQYQGVVIELAPNELHRSMLHLSECDLEDREDEGIVFHYNNQKFIDPSKVLKNIIVIEALTRK